MKFLILTAASIICTAASYPLMKALVWLNGLMRPNFRGEEIPSGFGYLLVLSAFPVYFLAMTYWPIAWRETWSFAVGVLVFGTLGLLDDIYGSRSTGGFRGHFTQLARGKVTTGAVKALGGGITALLLGSIAAGFDPFITLLNGLVIALTANLLNLLDLRPGRAVSCYWLLLLALVLSRWNGSWNWWLLLPVLPAAVWLTYMDRRAKVMLGDAGSNVLGAVLGLAFAWNLSVVPKLAILAALIGIHAYSETYSISRLIDSHPVLRRIDCKLGER